MNVLSGFLGFIKGVFLLVMLVRIMMLKKKKKKIFESSVDGDDKEVDIKEIKRVFLIDK